MSEVLTPPEGFELEPWERGFGRTVGPLYIRHAADGAATMGFRVGESHVSALGGCHGGMLLNFADMAWGWVAGRPPGSGWVTVRIVADFLAGARQGDWIEARSDLIAFNDDLYTVAGRLTVGERTILSGTGVYKLVTADAAAVAKAVGTT